jgi:hypothetical protein
MSGQVDGFGSRAASATPRSFRNAGLTKTLMLFESCEFCRAGAAHLSSADLRCRRFRRSRKCHASGTLRPAGSGTGVMPQEARRSRSEVLGCFGTEGAVRCDTWTLRTCKEGTVRGGDKGRRV